MIIVHLYIYIYIYIYIFVLGELPTYDINESFGAAEKSLVLTLLKQEQHFVWIRFATVTYDVLYKTLAQNLCLLCLIK